MNIEDSMRKSFDPNAFEFNEAHWEGAKVLLDKEFAAQALYRHLIYTTIVLLFVGIVGYHFLVNQASVLPDTLEEEQYSSPLNVAAAPIDAVEESMTVGEQKDALPPETEQLQIEAKTNVGSQNNSISSSQNISMLKEGPSDTSNFDSPQVVESEYTAGGERNSEAKLQSDSRVSMYTLDKGLANEFSDNNMASSESIMEEDLNEQLALHPRAFSVTPLILNELSTYVVTSLSGSGSRSALSDLAVSGNSKSIVRVQNPVAKTFIGTELMLYPTPSSNEFSYIGFSLGISRQIPIGRMYFLEAGLKGVARMGEFSPSQQSTQLSFDFAPRENAYVLNPSAVISMQVPLMVGFESGRSQVSGGVIPAVLLGVWGSSVFQGQLHPWESDMGGSQAIDNTVGRGWLDNSGFNRFALSYGLRYHYTLNSSIQLGMSVQYRPGDWVGEDYGKYFDFRKMDYVYTSADQRNLIKRNWIVGFELRYRI